MRLDRLIEQLLATIGQERVLLRRLSRYVAPLLLLPIGFALAQIVRGHLGLIIGAFGAMILLVQIELFLRPSLERARITSHDLTFYLGLPAKRAQPDSRPAIVLILPSGLALCVSMALFLPAILAGAAPWQRLLALALGILALYTIWQRLVRATTLLDSVEQRLIGARSELLSTGQAAHTKGQIPTLGSGSSVGALASKTRAAKGLSDNDLLDPALSHRTSGAPLPLLPLSPAAQALLRVEAYLMLRDFAGTGERELREALAELGHQAYRDELCHWLLPPVGGKIYLPVAANGTVARLLGSTMRRFGLDGGYSATLGTWLVRLPPARSYAVAGRLIDALLALGLAPAGGVLPHHLTIQGDLGQASKLLSIVHLLAAPLLFEERAGPAQSDERLFIMRGGGVLDNMGGRGHYRGPRTDFVDGFIFVNLPEMQAVEHLTAHTVNLRIKQVLAFGLAASARPYERRAPVEHQAANAYARLNREMRDLLEQYGLGDMLMIDWLDGHWSELWPLIQRMSELKARQPALMDAARRLRDTALDEIEGIVMAATHELRR